METEHFGYVIVQHLIKFSTCPHDIIYIFQIYIFLLDNSPQQELNNKTPSLGSMKSVEGFIWKMLVLKMCLSDVGTKEPGEHEVSKLPKMINVSFKL